MVIPSMPGLPLFSRTRCHARSRLSRSHTSSMSRSSNAGLWGSLLATSGSVPPRSVPGGSPPCPVGEARQSWIFGRIPPMRFESYLPLPIVRAFDQRSRLGLSVGSAFGPWSASRALPVCLRCGASSEADMVGSLLVTLAGRPWQPSPRMRMARRRRSGRVGHNRAVGRTRADSGILLCLCRQSFVTSASYSAIRYNDTHGHNQPESGSLRPLTNRHPGNRRKLDDRRHRRIADSPLIGYHSP
jgi:hypothetical protein